MRLTETRTEHAPVVWGTTFQWRIVHWRLTHAELTAFAYLATTTASNIARFNRYFIQILATTGVKLTNGKLYRPKV